MIGIITAVDNERDSVLHKMTGTKTLVLYNVIFYQGFIHHTPCVTAMSGVGKVNAARCSQLMIDQFQPEKIVNLGSAGAIHPDINIGDVVISTACIQHDVDLTVFGIKKGAFDEQDCGFFQADPDFAELCQEAVANSIGNKFKIFSGVIATGDQFNDSPEKKSQLFEEFGAYCNEMEGAAVAQVCALCKIPFVVIRSISDTPGNESKMLYNDYKQLASERCADFLVNIITIIEKSEPKLTISTQKTKGVKSVQNVESFQLDHDQVVAPYVRKAKVINVNHQSPECYISKFDVRFAQPNQEFIPCDALHTLEHLLATFTRKYTDDLIDVSPMGCRTGFYLIFCNNKEVTWVTELVRKALQEVLHFTDPIPGTTRKECGNYLDHNLETAKLWAEKFLAVPEAEIKNIYR